PVFGPNRAAGGHPMASKHVLDQLVAVDRRIESLPNPVVTELSSAQIEHHDVSKILAEFEDVNIRCGLHQVESVRSDVVEHVHLAPHHLGPGGTQTWKRPEYDLIDRRRTKIVLWVNSHLQSFSRRRNETEGAGPNVLTVRLADSDCESVWY